MADILNQIRAMSTCPSGSDAFEAWLGNRDALEFVAVDASRPEIVIYAVTDHVFIHGILVPSALASPPDTDDLMLWNFNASSSWGVSFCSSDPSSIRVSEPPGTTGSRTLDRGEQLVFARFFEGRLEDKGYFDILQKFTHVCGLHFVREKKAYCRLDGRGDVEEVISFLSLEGKERGVNGAVITVRRDALDEYMVLTRSALVRTFDFTRFDASRFYGWQDAPTFESKGDLFYRSVVQPGNGSYLRGCQIVRPGVTAKDVFERYSFGRGKHAQYASFIAMDWKNKVVREISCAPGETGNYFTESALPFETSPAFFRSEVLQKYKADSEKYRLEARSISCRGTWHLQTYDINEEGQVHTYLVDLRNLPYEEQLYWKSCNEKPRGTISKRALTTDFEGRWDASYDPLESLKQLTCELDRDRVPWWSLRSEGLIEKVHYPVTQSADEWADELLRLDQLIVEGLEVKWLRRRAESLGRKPDAKLASVALLGECLVGLGFDEGRTHGVVGPLRALHSLRSKLRGHASGREAVQITSDVLSKFRSFREHFRDLCAQCDKALGLVREALGEGKGDPPHSPSA